MLGFIVGLLVYGGLRLLEALGWPDTRYEVLLAMSAGLMQLIPNIGPIAGAIPAVAIGWSHSLSLALAVLALYIIIQRLVTMLVVPRLERKVVDIHPAIMVLIIVALSEFGFWWVLLAAPVTAVARDLFRYTYGRFGNPPRPAGLLPGEPIPPIVAEPAGRVARRRIPLISRRGPATGQSGKQIGFQKIIGPR